MVERDPGETWAEWLRERFDEHPTIRRPADLVRAGGDKPNGRPVIDASSVTQWLRGRRASFELAVVVAEAFSRSADEALTAAGYVTTTSRADVPWTDSVNVDWSNGDPVRDAIERAPLLGPDGRERVLHTYDFEVARESQARGA